MSLQAELLTGCPVRKEIADFVVADSLAVAAVSPDPAATKTHQYMVRCNERAQAARVLMDLLPMLANEYDAAKLAAAPGAPQPAEVAR